MKSHTAMMLGMILLGVMVAACHSQRAPGSSEPTDSTEPKDSTDALAGTTWELVAIQSMSDEVGTVATENPELYTLSFGRDGRVAMRLNCNRGTGTWQATPSSASSGSVRFGPLAVTRALCPPPSLDERIADDMAFARSYVLENGNLYLSLMADGGIYVWKPAP